MTGEQVQAFLAYTARFEQIMAEFPLEIRKGDIESYEKYLKSKQLENDPALTTAAIRYINLCSEEFFLNNVGVIPDEVWSRWKLSIRNMFRAAWLRNKWKEFRDNYSAYPEFRQFLDDLLSTL